MPDIKRDMRALIALSMGVVNGVKTEILLLMRIGGQIIVAAEQVVWAEALLTPPWPFPEVEV